MRRYETDSSRAAARILAHALLADGVLDQAELDSLARSGVTRTLGIERAAFDEVLRHYCEDLMMGSAYLDSLQLRLTDDVLPHLLDEIRDPAFRRLLLEAIDEIAAADGVRTAEESALIAQAARHWGLTAAVHARPCG